MNTLTIIGGTMTDAELITEGGETAQIPQEQFKNAYIINGKTNLKSINLLSLGNTTVQICK